VGSLTPAGSASDVLAYEIKMLIYAAGRVRDILAAPTSTEDKDAMTEVFLLHARNLREFLCQPRAQRKYKNDIVAGDLLSAADAATWENVDHLTAMPYVASKKERVNVELSHMSSGRFGNKTEWDLGAMFDELARELQSFRALQSPAAASAIRWPSAAFVQSLAGTVTHTNQQITSITPTKSST
jgi:hypothetical protein